MSLELNDKIKWVPVEELKPHPKNRNTHPQDQVDRLAKLIHANGLRSPLVISKRSGYIVKGHGTLKAILQLGLAKAPVSEQDFESEAQEYAYMVSDNAIGDWAKLDFAGINLDIQDLGPEFDIDMLGIKDFEVTPEDKEGFTDPDSLPPPTDGRVKLGQLWKLGEHYLMCGDSTSNDDVKKLMRGELADMVFTDPPYGVDYEGGHNEKKREKIENDALTGVDLTGLFQNALKLACQYSQASAPFYIWYASGKSIETFAAFAQLPLSVRAIIAWYKVNSGLGAFMAQYIPNYEPCIYAFKTGHSPFWDGPTNEKTVWELKRDSKNEFHPTQKPTELALRAMKNSSPQNGIILDLFGGSGSTLIAAEECGRRTRLMELSPAYCSVILKRWEDFTQSKASLLKTKPQPVDKDEDR